mmetsp:Transcript_50959/g.164977  ORF Transcript_50959/g.164977 Transcript_50959/m.164977 type:complete len:242 (+) Transcript_50959:115-840(+)
MVRAHQKLGASLHACDFDHLVFLHVMRFVDMPAELELPRGCAPTRLEAAAVARVGGVEPGRGQGALARWSARQERRHRAASPCTAARRRDLLLRCNNCGCELSLLNSWRGRHSRGAHAESCPTCISQPLGAAWPRRPCRKVTTRRRHGVPQFRHRRGMPLCGASGVRLVARLVNADRRLIKLAVQPLARLVLQFCLNIQRGHSQQILHGFVSRQAAANVQKAALRKDHKQEQRGHLGGRLT